MIRERSFSMKHHIIIKKIMTGRMLLLFFAVLSMNTPLMSAESEAYMGLVLPFGLNEQEFYVPQDNPLTEAKIELGRLLFFDKRLSVDNSIACASCHSPAHGFTDGRRVSLGVAGQQGDRNAPTLINRGVSKAQFWDGRAKSLEAQVTGPLTNALEMGMPSLGAVVKKIASIKGYRDRFKKVFGRGVTIEDIAKAIASFERTILSGNSKWDRYLAGDKFALSLSEKRGLEVFEGKGRCDQCHSGWNFTDEKFHNIGIDWDVSRVDLGRYLVTGKEKDIGAFKTPTLREISRTAPYMHDGRFGRLSEVVDYYNDGGISNPFLSTEMTRPDQSLDETLAEFEKGSADSNALMGHDVSGGSVPIKKLDLTEQEKEDLVAFLIALGGEGWQALDAPLAFPR